MIVKTLRTTALLLGVVLISLTLTGQPVLAAKKGPVILSVSVDFVVHEITIKGVGFMPGVDAPAVKLGGITLALTAPSPTDTMIVAECPLDPPSTGMPFCADGDFLLKVTSVVYDDDGDRDTKSVAYDLTIADVVTAADLAAETTARMAADAAEEAARIAADAAEEAARMAADAAEEAARIAADAAEEAARIAADAGLQAQIDALTARVATLEAKKHSSWDGDD